MVKKLAKWIVYSILFLGMFLYFFPKKSGYYYLQRALKPYHIQLVQNQIKENPFGLELMYVKVFYEGIEAARAIEVNIFFTGVYNTVDIKNIHLASLMQSYLPLDIASIHIQSALWQGSIVKFDAKGGFGNATGSIDIVQRKVVVFIKPSKKLQQNFYQTLRMLQKTSDGRYKYEQTF